MKVLPLLLLALLSLNSKGQDTINLSGQKYRLLHKITSPIIYDTIVFNKTHDTAFIYRSKNIKNANTQLTLYGFDSTELLVSNEDYSNAKYYYNYFQKKYNKHWHTRKKTYTDYGGYDGITNVVLKRIFYYHWDYSHDAESASGENYLVQNKPPTTKQLRKLIARTCVRKNINFYIQEM